MAEWEYFDRPASVVESNISTMNARADELIAEAQAIIQELGSLTFDSEPAAPNIGLEAVTVQPPVNPSPPTSPNFGDIYTPTGLEWEDLGDGLADVGSILQDLERLPPFEPKSAAVVTIGRPDPIDTSGMPTADDNWGEVTIPPAPPDELVSMGGLIDIAVPEFVFPTLPDFDGVEPSFSEPRPNSNLVWAEPTYSSPLLDEEIAKVREWLRGGTGLPPEIEQALFDKARSREVDTALEAKQGAFDTWAGRGFSMPPGMLVEQVNVANEKSRLAQNTLEREILIKSAEWEIENLRVAVEKGIALEGMLLAQFNSTAQRMFDAAKYRVEADINMFNAMVAVFNSQTQAYQIGAQVFKIRLEAALTELDVYKARLEGEKIKGEINTQTVAVFSERVKATMLAVEKYKSRMEGARIESDLIKNRIEAFKAEIEAYAAKIDSEKKRFEAYEAEVRGETAKAQSLEAEARAYAATVSAVEAKANVKTKYLEARISGINASVSKYTADIDLERLQVTSSLSEIQANAAAFSADVGRYSAEIQGANETTRTELMVSEARLRNNLAYYETQVKEFDARMNRVLQQATLIVESLKAAGQYTAAMAQGAMSAIHVSAGMSGSGTVSDSNSYSRSFQEQHQYKHGGA